jgi:hypothetical protein
MEELAFVSESFSNGKWTSTYIHPHSVQSVVKDLTQKEFKVAMSLAATALQKMNSSAENVCYKEALDKEVKSYTQALSQEKEDLEARLDLARKNAASERIIIAEKFSEEIKQLKSSLAISEQAVKDISGKSEIMFKNLLDEVKQQMATSHSQEMSRMEAAYQRFQVNSDQQHKEAMSALKASYSELEDKLRKELSKATAAATASASVEIGKQGEMKFEDMVDKYTQWGPLKNTSKLDHHGDRMCKIRECEVMFEVKEYTNVVPSTEVDKFKRDMEEHPDFHLGVFASMNTNISKKSGSYIQMEWTSRSQLLIYINRLQSHSLEDIFAFLDVCVDIALRMNKMAHERPEDSETCILQQEMINRCKDLAEREMKRILDYMNTMNINKSTLIQTITKHYDENRIFMKQVVASLNESLEILSGKSQEMPAEAEGSASGSTSSTATVATLPTSPSPTAPTTMGQKKSRAAKKSQG